jgi:hypothetical protein
MKLSETGWKIYSLADFTASNMTGRRGKPYSAGRLDEDEHAILRSEHDQILYTVYSYNTPIAWRTASGWHLVGQRFSQSTSRHQNIVRGAV